MPLILYYSPTHTCTHIAYLMRRYKHFMVFRIFSLEQVNLYTYIIGHMAVTREK